LHPKCPHSLRSCQGEWRFCPRCCRYCSRKRRRKAVRGNANFIKDRLQRIAVPLVVGWPILFPATHRRWFSGPLPSQMVARCQVWWIGRRCYRVFPWTTFGSFMFCWNAMRNSSAAYRLGLARQERPIANADRPPRWSRRAKQSCSTDLGRSNWHRSKYGPILGVAADDPLEAVSGTNGVTGAVDAVLVLNRDGKGTTCMGGAGISRKSKPP
jgi:hypothetical protein